MRQFGSNIKFEPDAKLEPETDSDRKQIVSKFIKEFIKSSTIVDDHSNSSQIEV